MTDLERDLASLLNRYSQENTSNTPDFILAQYLRGCLGVFNIAVQQRENWYGRDPRPTSALAGDVHRNGVIHSDCEDAKVDGA